ncbi:MAG: response regulator [Candidatus Omnitrophica bacterium]|nr:response regulator [Candidatus Omnitrophota bacterium]
MKKILIADDEVDALKFLEKRLKLEKYGVTAVNNSGDVIKLAKSDKPDLFILDIAMPGMDGYALAATMRKDSELKNIPVIFITGKEFVPKAMEEITRDAGAYDYIMKPCSFEEILSKVQTVLG